MQKSFAFSAECPVLVSPFLERQGGEVGMDRLRLRTSEGARAHISYLYLSAMKSPMD